MPWVIQNRIVAQGWVGTGLANRANLQGIAHVWGVARDGHQITASVQQTVWVNGAPIMLGNSIETGSGVTTAPNASLTFDTAGNVVPTAAGTIALTGSKIWAQGIEVSGDDLPGDGTISFADAYCCPLFDDEIVTLGRGWANGKLIYTPTDGPLLSGMTAPRLYQGGPLQAVDAAIAADKTSARTPAFRGLRYIVFDDFPLGEVGGSPPSTFWEFITADRLNLSDVLTRIMNRSGLEATIEGVEDIVDNCVFPSGVNPQQLLRDLAEIYNFQVHDFVEPIRISRRAINNDLVIDLELDTARDGDFRADSTDDPVIHFERPDPAELPAVVTVQFIDQDTDYQQNGAQDAWPENFIPSSLANTQQLNFGITAVEASALATGKMARSYFEAATQKFSLSDLRPEAGDVIRVTTEAGTFVLRGTRCSVAADNSITLESKALLSQFNVEATADSGDVISQTVVHASVTRRWIGMDCTPDFSKILAAVAGDYIYTSDNGARSFTKRIQPGQRDWVDVSQSFVVALDGYVFSNFDASGKAWTYEPPIALYNRVASNPSGNAMFGLGFSGAGTSTPAVQRFSPATDLYLDGDNGEYVAGIDIDDAAHIIAVAIYSSAGSFVAVSTNGGTNFGTPVSIGGGSPIKLKMSGDGSIIVVLRLVDVPLISFDSGASFADAAVPAGAYFFDLKVTSSGQHIMLIGSGIFSDGATVFLSSDAGVTFDPIPDAPADQPSCGCISDDGSQMAIGFNPGYIYHSVAPFTSWTQQVY